MIEKKYEFSGVLRFNHWVRVFTMLVLVITGFYIADPFIIPFYSSEPVDFMNALWRSWHVIFGFVFVASAIFKLYLFIFDRESENERISFFDFIKPRIWVQQIKYYMLIGKHPHSKGIYNPLQFVIYTIIFITFIFMSLTGLILYMHLYHEGLGGLLFDILRPMEVFFGGLASVRAIHHATMWIFLMFIPIHIYLAIFNSIYGKHGTMDSIFSGYSWHQKYFKRRKNKK
ncbi:Ni/Fe-hydrogenase, b-type cytochrome subunit [bacterium]|nr:Ni/Fe-hydrogenase, b-type cytochrome subunit [bacterium]MBU1989426.1 Ni/Fe-hydrogenase, b-type cytochrome subunit [bacterium]